MVIIALTIVAFVMLWVFREKISCCKGTKGNQLTMEPNPDESALEPAVLDAHESHTFCNPNKQSDDIELGNTGDKLANDSLVEPSKNVKIEQSR